MFCGCSVYACSLCCRRAYPTSWLLHPFLQPCMAVFESLSSFSDVRHSRDISLHHSSPPPLHIHLPTFRTSAPLGSVHPSPRLLILLGPTGPHRSLNSSFSLSRRTCPPMPGDVVHIVVLTTFLTFSLLLPLHSRSSTCLLMVYLGVFGRKRCVAPTASDCPDHLLVHPLLLYLQSCLTLTFLPTFIYFTYQILFCLFPSDIPGLLSPLRPVACGVLFLFHNLPDVSFFHLSSSPLVSIWCYLIYLCPIQSCLSNQLLPVAHGLSFPSRTLFYLLQFLQPSSVAAFDALSLSILITCPILCSTHLSTFHLIVLTPSMFLTSCIFLPSLSICLSGCSVFLLQMYL